MKLIRLVNWLSIAFAATLVFASLVFAYILLAPIDIVTNWQLRVDAQTYRPGDDITVRASYKKLRDANGQAYYYLECKTARESLIRFPISQTEGNRPKGAGEVEIPLHLPSDLPSLPAECRIAISVDYTIYTFRKFVENNETNYFRIEQ